MYLLAIDQGTSSTRAMLFTLTGELITASQYSLSQSYPHPGWVEQEAEEIWNKTVTAMRDVVSQVNLKDIIACGITNQRETTVIWDKQTGQCIGLTIVWRDRRTHDYCQSISEYATMIHSKTGLILDFY